ncbi:MAG: hypothetical protein BWY06_02896 [Candidatus Latescibacteria bacterium ADurb.Bin168]|nr:MAG: hypothetical protein BWY06_02896 [Candidatus Latescibacteria bacterium ADurb.Bin168]
MAFSIATRVINWPSSSRASSAVIISPMGCSYSSVSPRITVTTSEESPLAAPASTFRWTSSFKNCQSSTGTTPRSYTRSRTGPSTVLAMSRFFPPPAFNHWIAFRFGRIPETETVPGAVEGLPASESRKCSTRWRFRSPMIGFMRTTGGTEFRAFLLSVSSSRGFFLTLNEKGAITSRGATIPSRQLLYSFIRSRGKSAMKRPIPTSPTRMRKYLRYSSVNRPRKDRRRRTRTPSWRTSR